MKRRTFIGAIAGQRVFAQLPIELMRKPRFTWCVDSVNGSDSNSGRSPGSAFATIAKLLEQTIRTGDRIGLACGSHWREQFTVPCSGLRISAYGIGAKPILDCSDVIAAGSWAKSGGYTNIYQATVTTNSGGATCFLNTWENSICLLRAASLAACDAMPGTYFPSSDVDTSLTLYVHATGSGDPAGNGKAYEYSAREFGLESFSTERTRITGLACRRNLHNGGSLRLGRFGVATECEANDGNAHNILVREGCVCNRVTANEAYFAGASLNVFVFYEDTPTGLPVEFNDCSVSVATFNATATGFYGHRGVSGLFGPVTFSRCTVTNCGGGWAGTHASSISLNSCETTGCNSSVNSTVAEFLINNCSLRALLRCITPESGAVRVRNSILTGVGGAVQAIVRTFSANVTVDIQDTVMSGAGIGIRLDQAGPTLISLRNTLTGANSWMYYLATGAAVTSDYNSFVTCADKMWIAPTEYTLATWRAATGQDAHSTPLP